MEMKRRYLLAATATVLIALSGCSNTATLQPSDEVAAPSAGTSDPASFLAGHDLAGMEGTEIIDHLDRLAVNERPSDLMASVRPDQLVLADANEEIALDLPEDSFYLSIAPYVDQTHDCFYHSLTTCQGELAGQDVAVRILDVAGDVLVEEQVTTYDNGFVGFWLPGGVEGTVEVTYDGLTGQAAFSATEEGATCLTTLQITEV